MSFNSEVDEQFREACCNGNTEMVCKLINGGIDVNSQNKMNGWTSLHWAAKRGHASIVSTLLQNNADPSLKNFNGKSAVDVAANENTRDILQKDSNILQHKSDAEVSVNKTTKVSERKDETKQVNTNISDNAQISFIPNYLSNPVFPHLQQNSGDNMHNPSNRLASNNLLKYDGRYEMTNRISNDETELVLKVRVVNSCDFIEVELGLSELTYDNLLNVCCTELDVSKDHIMKVRKLPNTILRKDKDVKRLKQFQELELVMNNN